MVCLHSVLWWCILHKVSATGAVTVKKQIAVVNLASSLGLARLTTSFCLFNAGQVMELKRSV